MILTTIVITIAVIFIALYSEKPENRFVSNFAEDISTQFICPPFYFLTEEGDTIDPSRNLNTGKPYSPKQTCGKCHDYELITKGDRFQQGKGKMPLDVQMERMQWVSTPGNYGGPWCSPAPLYWYLSEKQNETQFIYSNNTIPKS